MDKIKEVIDIFLEPYKNDDNIQAAILTGSYAQGYQNKHSDIDIFIISSDTLNWRERGNIIISNYMVEYFVNPPKKIIQEIEEYKQLATALIIANGQVIFDKTGIVKKLKEKADNIINNQITPINDFEVEMIKYYTNHYYEQLSRAFENNTDEFYFLYYTILEHIIYSYGKYNGIVLPPKVKLYQYIYDNEYYINKDLKKIHESNFLDLLKKSMKNSTRETMYKNIIELKEYFISSVGGFNLNGWKMRGNVE